VLVSPDGRRPVPRGQDGDGRLWDARTGARLRAVKATWQRGLGMSPDGRFLVWPVTDETVKYKDSARPNVTHTGSRLRLYDVAADAFVDRFGRSEGGPQGLSFTPDGRDLVTVDHRDGPAAGRGVRQGTAGLPGGPRGRAGAGLLRSGVGALARREDAGGDVPAGSSWRPAGRGSRPSRRRPQSGLARPIDCGKSCDLRSEPPPACPAGRPRHTPGTGLSTAARTAGPSIHASASHRRPRLLVCPPRAAYNLSTVAAGPGAAPGRTGPRCFPTGSAPT
jgi:hypothetical protein